LQFSALSPTPYWEFYASGKARQFRVQGKLLSNHGATMIDAARQGLGVVLALSYQVQEHVARGELQVLLERFEPPPMPVHAVFPSGRLQPARVRAFADLLADRLGTKELTTLKLRRQRDAGTRR
jgi:DNA-binding transcriptional LysR family regulator